MAASRVASLDLKTLSMASKPTFRVCMRVKVSMVPNAHVHLFTCLWQDEDGVADTEGHESKEEEVC